MPLSKNRKKSKQKPHTNGFEKIKQSSDVAELVPGETIDSQQKSREILKKSPKKEFLNMLYENNGELLSQFISYLPLVISAWVLGGLGVRDTTAFGLVMSLMLIAHYLELMHKGRIPYEFTKLKQYAAHSLAFCVSLFFSYYVGNYFAGVILAIYYCLCLVPIYLSKDKVKNIFINLFALILRMSLLAILGGFCQTKEFFLPAIILGFIPAAFLLAADVALHSEIFVQEGWKRAHYVPKKNKAGETLLVIRPLGLSRAFVLFLVLGPLIPISLVPFGLLYDSFILAILPLYFMPNMANSFMEELKADKSLGIMALNFALLESLLVLVAGLIAAG